MSAAEIDAVLRSAQWHQQKGAEQFKIQLLQIIMDEIDKLSDEDVRGHIRWGHFFDFVNNTPVNLEIK
jgi:hypothetical protein